MGGTGDMRAAGADPATVAQLTLMSAVSDVLSGSHPDGTDGDLVARIAPRPLLLISAGQGLEAKANRDYVRRGGPAVEHWNLPRAPHAAALRSDRVGYEQHVISFLDRSLRR